MIIITKKAEQWHQQNAQVGNGTKEIWHTVIQWKYNDGMS